MELDINTDLKNVPSYQQLMTTTGVQTYLHDDGFGIAPPLTGDFTYWQPYVDRWYPACLPYWSQANKVETAFRLAQKLIKNKLITEPKTVKDFIELVNLLAEEL
jgi:hypothetical protein